MRHHQPGVDRRDSQRPRETQVPSRETPLQRIDGRAELGRDLERLGAGGGRHVACRQPLEQPHTEPRLQPVDPPQHSRVVDPETSRRRGERAGVGHGEGEAQVVPVHQLSRSGVCVLAGMVRAER